MFLRKVGVVLMLEEDKVVEIFGGSRWLELQVQPQRTDLSRAARVACINPMPPGVPQVGIVSDVIKWSVAHHG